MQNKRLACLRRAKKARAKIKSLHMVRLGVHRTSQHIYAQVIAPDGKVVAASSTLDEGVRQQCNGYGGNVNAAKVVGKRVAELARGANITKVAFDRSGFKYHGRVQALAEAAREHGLEF
jgi:large subunit ribosomal protein L18